MIAPEAFAPFIRERFETTGRRIDDDALDGALAITLGHPYATQELCYALWEETSPRGTRRTGGARRRDRAGPARRERPFHADLGPGLTVQRATLYALAREPLVSATAREFRQRHGLPGASSVQRALDALVEDEVVLRQAAGEYLIAEPFLAEWILRFP